MSADKEIPAAVFDTAAVITSGAPALSVIAEKVGLAQEFHDTEAAITAGAAVVAAVAEVVEGGIREIVATIISGPPSIAVDAETVGLTQPFHDTAAALASGPASVAIAARLVGLANEFHDAAACDRSGTAGPRHRVRGSRRRHLRFVASLVAGVPQVEVEAAAVALADAFTDRLSVSRRARHRSLSVVLKSERHRSAQAHLRTRLPAASPPLSARCWQVACCGL